VAGEWKLPLVIRYYAVYDKFIGETEREFRSVSRSRGWLRACCGSTNWKKSSPEAAPIRLRRRRRFVASAGVVSLLDAERQPAVFVAATCNNVTVAAAGVDPQGRFDELFFVDCQVQPSAGRYRDSVGEAQTQSGDYDLDRVAEAAKGFSGAED